MFFGLKLRAAMLCRPVINMFGPEAANALGRGIANAGGDWKELIGRLRAQRLSPDEAGSVAAAWLARHTPPDRLGFDLPRAMTYSSNVLANAIVDAHRWDRHRAIRRAMAIEGLDDDEESLDVEAESETNLQARVSILEEMLKHDKDCQSRADRHAECDCQGDVNQAAYREIVKLWTAAACASPIYDKKAWNSIVSQLQAIDVVP